MERSARARAADDPSHTITTHQNLNLTFDLKLTSISHTFTHPRTAFSRSDSFSTTTILLPQTSSHLPSNHQMDRIGTFDSAHDFYT